MKKILLLLLIPLFCTCEEEQQEYDIIDIGTWDMLTDEFKQISYSSNLYPITPELKQVEAIIFNNDLSKETKLYSWNDNIGDYNGTAYIFDGKIHLKRTNEGIFKSSEYDGDQNRGLIKIPK